MYNTCFDLNKLGDKLTTCRYISVYSLLVFNCPNTDKNTSSCQIEASDNFVFGPFVIKSINGRHLDDSVVPEKNPYFFFLLL